MKIWGIFHIADTRTFEEKDMDRCQCSNIEYSVVFKMLVVAQVSAKKSCQQPINTQLRGEIYVQLADLVAIGTTPVDWKTVTQALTL